jgi:hypothetical protein
MSSNLTTPSPSKKSNKDASSTGKRRKTPTTETPPDISMGNLVESEMVPVAASKDHYPGVDVVVVSEDDGAITPGYTRCLAPSEVIMTGLRDDVAAIREDVAAIREDLEAGEVRLAALELKIQNNRERRANLSATQLRIQKLEDDKEVGRRPIGRSWMDAGAFSS